MTLDEEQKKIVQGWLTEGQSLSDIQNLLKSELDIGLTYMEVRFLVDDLGLELKDPEPEPDPNAEDKTEPAPAAPNPQPAEGTADSSEGSAAPDDSSEKPAGGGSVSIDVDKITRPGSIVSGHVTFSDGKKAEWMLDQTGRLGLIPEVEGYQATPGDIAEFQASLQEELKKLGF